MQQIIRHRAGAVAVEDPLGDCGTLVRMSICRHHRVAHDLVGDGTAELGRLATAVQLVLSQMLPKRILQRRYSPQNLVPVSQGFCFKKNGIEKDKDLSV